MVRLLLFILFALIFSCSIIEDSDITSYEELRNLEFTAFEIRQETNSGSSTLRATLVHDSPIDIINSSGVHVTREKLFSMPAIGNLKMKFRSGITNPVEFSFWYREDGKLNSVAILEGDVLKEVYSFDYDVSGKLAKIRTYAPVVQGQGPTTTDDLIYNTSGKFVGKISKIIRSSPTVSLSGTLEVNYFDGTNGPPSGYSGPFGDLLEFTFQNVDYRNYFIWSRGEEQYISLDNFELTRALVIGERRFEADGTCERCNRELDTYYFHPLMVLNNQVEMGQDLLTLYMIDWWVPGTANENLSLSKDDRVTIRLR